MRQLVAPLRGESILAQCLVLQADLLAFLVVGGEAKAAGPPERVSGDRLQPVERRFGALPELLGRFGTVRLACNVVPRRTAAEREAAVATARSCGDSARVVHTHA